MAVREQARGATKAAAPRASASWKLQDAKAKFSELVRKAQSEGPQRVTVRGKDAVVLISAEELDRLLAPPPTEPLVEFLESLYVEGLDLTRERDTGRDFTP
ncbi:MAG: prevent-host-death protein [Methylocystaceae bacterium]|nr:MAG: prevent-host-death protein [Methylocystaceae bacterium]